MDHSINGNGAEPGASIGTSKLLWAENGSFPPNSGPIYELRQRKLCCPKTPAHSTSAFADIKRIIDEPEWEAFHKDLSSSDFQRIRVATLEPEAFSDEKIDFLACGSATKNGEKRKRSENSLLDHPDSPSHWHKRVKTETEQSMEICEREKDRDSEILALTPIELNVRNCSVKTEELALNLNSNAVCLANSDARKRIKQESEWSRILESPVPTLDSENQSRVALNGNCEPGMAESLQETAINNQVSSIVLETLSVKQESEPLEECTNPNDRAFTVNDSDSAHCNSIAEGVISPISKLDSEQDSLLSNNASDAVVSSYVKAEPVTEDSIAMYPVQLSNNDIEHKNFDLFPKDTGPSTGSDHDGNMSAVSFAKDRIPTSIAENGLVPGKPLVKKFSFESDKCQVVRRSSRSKGEKGSYKETSDHDESSPKVSSEDGDSSEEDFVPDEQLSDDNVEIKKSKALIKPSEDFMNDEQLLEEIVDTVKSNALFKPFCESELESLAPLVLKFWKTKGFMNLGVKSIISRYIQQEPKYLQMLKMYVYDGIDEDAIRSLPFGFNYGSERFRLRVKCPVCGKTLTKFLFENHMNCHANCRPYKCEKCGRRYVSEAARIIHEKESKCSGKRFECKVCGKVYESKQGLRIHEKSHDPKKMHKCHICDAVFVLLASLKEHVARHRNAKDPNQLANLFQCAVCSKQFVTKQLMNRHHTRVHLEKECKKCNAKFESEYQYNKHIRMHNNGTEKPLKCPQCDKHFAIHYLLKNHIRSHTGEKPHMCDICGNAFTQKSDLKRHMHIHLTKVILSAHERQSRCSGKQFECKECGKVYESKRGLRFHKRLYDPKKIHKCHICEAVFPLPCSLKKHVVRHTNAKDPSQLVKLFQCAVCSQQFATKQIMDCHHSEIHLKKALQPKECKICHTKFQSLYRYQRHIQLHSKRAKKPLKCPHCDKGFAHDHVLKHHIMTHTGEKPHKCDICGHAFTQMVALNKHMFTHQGKKPYRCDKCGKDSHRKQDIIEHKCPMDKSSGVTMEGDKDPVPAPVLNKAQNSSSTKKKKVSVLVKSNLNNETDKCANIRRSLRSKPEKVTYKEHSDDDESTPKVSSVDGDSSDEVFKPEERLSDDKVDIMKSKPCEDLMNDEQLLKEIVDVVKSNPLFKPFCESELGSLAPEVLKLWKTGGFLNCGVKSIICRYIQQEPKYLEMLKAYVHDGIDEDAVRLLPVCFSYGSERIQLRVKCPVCSKTVTKDLFQNHMNDHSNCRPHMCEKCGSRFVTEGALITHEKETRCSGKLFECKMCGKIYESERGLRIHDKLHDANREMHKCHMCDAVFALRASLKEHVVCHTNAKDSNHLAKPFQCAVCGEQFSTKRLMNRHHSQIHLKKAQQIRKCKKCNAKFQTCYQYQKHVNMHNTGTEKPLKCPHCDKRFVIHHDLQTHIMTHTGEKPHKCDICGHACTQKVTLRKHMLTHSQQVRAKKLLKCPHCNKRFARNIVLKHHIMTHTGEKPHKCDICGHAFTQKIAMNKHRFTHQGRKPYRCDICGKDSLRKQDIIEHKCPMDKSSAVTKGGDKDPVPAPVLNKAQNLSSTKKKKAAFLSKSNLTDETDKCTEIRRSLRSKPMKVSYKEHSDDDEFQPKVSSEDGDSSGEDFKPDYQLSDGELENNKDDTVIRA